MQTIVNDISHLYKAQQAYFDSGATRSYTFRKEQLKKLKKALKEHEQLLMDALYKDLRKPPMEAYAGEVGLLYSNIDFMLENLRNWMRPEEVTSPLVAYPSKSRIYKDPLGLTLLISPWNYPLLLLFNPLAGAIAGGNCAVLKPSELAPATASVIDKIIKNTFDPAYIAVVQGEGAEVIPALMKFRFDHVFFTGSVAVGKKVMEMATPHLTPVTLELGGKSPVLVDEKVNIKLAARRIVWGKFWNAGQICVAPDYLLVHHRVKEELVQAMKASLHAFYGENPAASKDYARIINHRRFDTLCEFLSQGRIITGGQTDRNDLYIAPTLLEDVSWDDPVMQEEIFGPILPVITYQDLPEALNMIKQNPYPLAMYIFTSSKRTEKKILSEVRFGGGCVNDTVVHLTNPELPFGGVGFSGMGHYYGQYSFETFTHKKGILKSATWIDAPLKYPPYKNKINLARKLI